MPAAPPWPSYLPPPWAASPSPASNADGNIQLHCRRSTQRMDHTHNPHGPSVWFELLRAVSKCVSCLTQAKFEPPPCSVPMLPCTTGTIIISHDASPKLTASAPVSWRKLTRSHLHALCPCSHAHCTTGTITITDDASPQTHRICLSQLT